ncbi:expressed protein [Phakopsora pachyrhizi]|uniref:Expressed protein n=1 Tax=Phakopsora pachyrhizi TaxID=170000 RepID=A0AAV0BJL4_PHAPC|nr:expressed protein [Phakopsora pachyrhizi]
MGRPKVRVITLPICPICLDRGELENYVVTSCGHVFHSDCIRDWEERRQYGRCPTCSNRIVNSKTKLYSLSESSFEDPIETEKRKEELARLAASTVTDKKKIEYFSNQLRSNLEIIDRSSTETRRLKAEVEDLNSRLSKLQNSLKSLHQERTNDSKEFEERINSQKRNREIARSIFLSERESFRRVIISLEEKLKKAQEAPSSPPSNNDDQKIRKLVADLQSARSSNLESEITNNNLRLKVESQSKLVDQLESKVLKLENEKQESNFQKSSTLEDQSSSKLELENECSQSNLGTGNNNLTRMSNGSLIGTSFQTFVEADQQQLESLNANVEMLTQFQKSEGSRLDGLERTVEKLIAESTASRNEEEARIRSSKDSSKENELLKARLEKLEKTLNVLKSDLSKEQKQVKIHNRLIDRNKHKQDSDMGEMKRMIRELNESSKENKKEMEKKKREEKT